MKLAIMQPYLFPYIGYFQLMNAVDKFVILDDVNYIKKGWINRNRILINGKEHLFTIPLKKVSQNKLISKCELVDDRWKQNFIKMIEMSYKKTPFFYQTFEVIKSITGYSEINLSRLIYNQLEIICSYLNISTEIVKTSVVYNNLHLKAQEKILDICKKEDATTYINAIGGQKLYNKEKFADYGIELKFMKSFDIFYKQFNNEFIPQLSIIDVMMFNSKEKIKEMLNKYELV